MDDLTVALAANRDAVIGALPGAERELAQLRARCAELEEEILRAHLIIGSQSGPGADDRLPRTMHEAMILILRDHPKGLKAPEIAHEIERRNLYRRRDGGPAGLGQVHARVHNYPRLFVRDNGRIRLRTESDN